jgi:flagellin-like protein
MRRPEKEKPIFPKNNPIRRFSDERGVSPVIAVILMVAITVVLSAVLYVMVMNLIGPQTETITISMRWDESSDEPGRYSGYITKISGNAPNIDDVTLGIVANEGVGSKKLDALKAEGNFTVGSITVNYHDVNNNDKLGAEDIFIINGVSQGDVFRLTHIRADDMITKTF